jgi:Xaa-Pro dipeptidase
MCLGKPAIRMREIYQAVRDASDACIAEIKNGVPAIRPHQAVKKVLESAGLSKYQDTSGYGIAPGFPPAWGESIHMFDGTEEVLNFRNGVVD